jgi:hypothetical protein
MAAADTWVGYLTWHARQVHDQFVQLRGRKQRKRAIASLYPLSQKESNSYRRYLWTRICRTQIELHRQRRHPGRFRLAGQ